MSWIAALALVLSAAPPSFVTVPDEADILQSLREHPRLIATDEDLARIRRLIETDPKASAIYDAVKRRADRMLNEKPIEHVLIGPRLLDKSRTCVDRVYTLATVYRIEGDRRYLDRAVTEMMTAAEFKDWNPSHFLDTAEMTHALGIGYDWLRDELTPDQRKTIREAIVTKGLLEGKKVYEGGGWWARVRHNWNQVCNGGLTIGALAIAEEEPELAAYIVHRAANSVQLAMEEFAPDGACVEGPGYWNYATRYNVYMLAALDSALGTDFGLSRFPGFDKTGDFRLHIVGPTKLVFNFADGGDGAGDAAQMFWFATKFDRPAYAYHEREIIQGATALHLWWYTAAGDSLAAEPTARHFRAADVVMMRDRWSDKATFVGLKGGSNAVNHSHLELGTFVLDAQGVRWGLDLGPDNYNLPGYFGNLRWTYYRLATEGQNTLWIGGENQAPRANAPVIAFVEQPDGQAHAVVDLQEANSLPWKRGAAIVANGQVLIQDEVQAGVGEAVVWQMHTRAKIELQGATATLRQGDKTLVARVLAPTDAVFAVEGASPPAPQRQQPDVQKLVIRRAGDGNSQTIAVLLSPGEAASAPGAEVVPLATWAR